jgi:hypothetical protein
LRTAIRTRIGVSDGSHERRYGKLDDAGLVEPVDSEHHRISDRGRGYPAGEIDADELE